MMDQLSEAQQTLCMLTSKVFVCLLGIRNTDDLELALQEKVRQVEQLKAKVGAISVLAHGQVSELAPAMAAIPATVAASRPVTSDSHSASASSPKLEAECALLTRCMQQMVTELSPGMPSEEWSEKLQAAIEDKERLLASQAALNERLDDWRSGFESEHGREADESDRWVVTIATVATKHRFRVGNPLSPCQNVNYPGFLEVPGRKSKLPQALKNLACQLVWL